MIPEILKILFSQKWLKNSPAEWNRKPDSKAIPAAHGAEQCHAIRPGDCKVTDFCLKKIQGQNLPNFRRQCGTDSTFKMININETPVSFPSFGDRIAEMIGC